MKQPRDSSAPTEGFPEPRQATGAFMIREYTPIDSMPMATGVTPPPTEKKVPSTGFIAALSVILGVIIAASVIIGGLGRAFFVTRDEFTHQEATYTNEKSELQTLLAKLEGAVAVQSTTLEKQDATLQRLVDKVQTIREDMARRGR
jgi:uncharacterized protein HemX